MHHDIWVEYPMPMAGYCFICEELKAVPSSRQAPTTIDIDGRGDGLSRHYFMRQLVMTTFACHISGNLRGMQARCGNGPPAFQLQPGSLNQYDILGKAQERMMSGKTQRMAMQIDLVGLFEDLCRTGINGQSYEGPHCHWKTVWKLGRHLKTRVCPNITEMIYFAYDDEGGLFSVNGIMDILF